MNLVIIILESIQSTFLKCSRDWYQKVNISKNWFHNFSSNLLWTIDIKESFISSCLLVYIKPEVLQSTFLKLSRYLCQKIDILKNRLHNFCSNLIWTMNFWGFLFLSRLFAGRSNFANIKLEVLQSTFLKWSMTDIKTLMFGKSYFINVVLIRFKPSR